MNLYRLIEIPTQVEPCIKSPVFIEEESDSADVELFKAEAIAAAPWDYLKTYIEDYFEAHPEMLYEKHHDFGNAVTIADHKVTFNDNLHVDDVFFRTHDSTVYLQPLTKETYLYPMHVSFPIDDSSDISEIEASIKALLNTLIKRKKIKQFRLELRIEDTSIETAHDKINQFIAEVKRMPEEERQHAIRFFELLEKVHSGNKLIDNICHMLRNNRFSMHVMEDILQLPSPHTKAFCAHMLSDTTTAYRCLELMAGVHRIARFTRDTAGYIFKRLTAPVTV